MRIAVLFGLVLVGCSPNFVAAKVAVPAFKLGAAPATASRPGVTVGVQPLGYGELEAGKVPVIKASWGEIDRSQVESGGKAGTKMRYGEVPLVPLPSFAVVIDNQSQAPVELKGATVTLEGKSGKKWKAILSSEDVAAEVDLAIRDRYPSAAQNNAVLEQLRDAVLKLPFLVKTTVVAPGQNFQGFLVFDLKAYNMQEVDKLLAAEQGFTMTFDALGGAPPLTVKLALDKDQATVNAQCPEGKPVAASVCRLPE